MRLSDKHRNYIDSRSEAILMSDTKVSRWIIWLTFLFFVLLLVWMYYAKVDQLIRGVGRVIPSIKTQVVQNLEGGIIAKVLVKEGDLVEVNQTVLELDKTSFESQKEENLLKTYELKAKIERLEAEAKDKKFIVQDGILKEKLLQEFLLYQINKNALNQEISILEKQLFQKQNELRELRAREEHLAENLHLTEEEVKMKKELLAQKVGSQNELNLAQQKLSSIKGEFTATKLSIPRLRSVIEEVQTEIKQHKIAFQQKAVKELNLAKDELARVEQLNISKKDRVTRATVRSPVTGIVQRILHNTIGGVVRAGEPIMEIIPTDDSLVINTKIRPSDIAFIYPNQEAVVRFSAYDFVIYGSLKAKVINISADTIVDEVDRQSYYQVKIKTDKNYLGTEGNRLEIMPGMIATVDIVGAKKTVLDYILKPILRAQQNVLSER
ncbi:MAG: HlyD family type I secretion periplasmic adaptor subunit [Epsilonproteobacteria bacterium]|nr:HlyD family type I secretion periplasmic adaptor subunit [Campylobacterota bacterium]